MLGAVAQGIFQRGRELSRSQGLRLRGSRGPARHDRNMQVLRDTSVIVTGQTPQRIGQQGSRRELARALAQGICLASVPQIRDQTHRGLVRQMDHIQIRHRQGKSRALQQSGTVPQPGEGRYPWRNPTLMHSFGFHQRMAQPGQRRQNGHAGQKQPIGHKYITDLRQQTRQVIDPVQRQAGHHQIKTGRSKGQPLVIHAHRRTAIARAHARRQVSRNRGDTPPTQQGGHNTPSTNIQRRAEGAGDIIQPVQKATGRFLQHGPDMIDLIRRTVPVQAHDTTVKYLWHIHAHPPDVPLRIRPANPTIA